MRGMPPLRREKLKDVLREEWDPMHKAVLKYKSKHAEWINRDNVRFHIYHQDDHVIKAWFRLPTKAQQLMGCNGCMGRQHSDKNLLCTVNTKKKIVFKVGGHLYNIKTKETLSRHWLPVAFELPRGYKTGYAEFFQK